MEESVWLDDEFLGNLARKRDYAGFYDWPDKPTKEVGITGTFFEAMEAREGRPFSDLRRSEKDPPDCLATDEQGRTIGVEVTELVSEEAARLSAQGKNVYRDWKFPEVVERLEQIIREKDAKLGASRPYSKLILLVHCAEPTVNPRDTPLDALGKHVFPAPSHIDEAFFLLDYWPDADGGGYYPYVALRLGTPKT